MSLSRSEGRGPQDMRSVTITPDFVAYPEGSILIACGQTRVLCNVTLEQVVPSWMKTQGIAGGWVTAEYALLPRSTRQRTPRETNGLGGRTQEIRRMIGRSLRAAVDLELLDGYTCIVDCDVLQADGGTRTASVTGAYMALVRALQPLIEKQVLPADVLSAQVAAVSVGIQQGIPLLDLDYAEDSGVDVDLNVVMNDRNEYIEVQGTAEGATISRHQLDGLLDLAEKGIQELLNIQGTFL